MKIEKLNWGTETEYGFCTGAGAKELAAKIDEIIDKVNALISKIEKEQ